MRVPAIPLVLLALACSCSEEPPPPGAGPASGEAGRADVSGGGRPRYAMVPKGTTHVFWTAVERGARAAAGELDVDLVWKGPLEENDRAQQIQLVQQFVSEGVDAILLAPLDHRALVGVVGSARDRGIPVLVWDSALEGTPGVDYAGFVATDNRAAGHLGGAHLAQLLGGRGRVVLLRYLVGSASTTKREEGFLEAVEAEGLEVLVQNRHAGASAGEAKTQALNMIDRIREADGVFSSNESATMGMLLALRQEGLAGSVRFVGFDASPALVAALRAGEIDALVLQDPERMGRLAVETMHTHLAGGAIPAVVDTGCTIATLANMDEPEIARLLE